MNRSAVLWWLGVAVLVVGLGLVLGRGRDDGPPLDPGSTGPLGTRAVVELVERFGAEVVRGLPDEDADVTLVLTDRLDEAARDRLRGWVGAGGVLVVADPGSPLAPPVAGIAEDRIERGVCGVTGLGGLAAVEAGALARFPVEPGGASCFGDAEQAWLVARPLGAGVVVALGGAAPLTNEQLAQADNAVVVTALLAPRAGTRVAVVYDPVAVAEGERDLLDLVPERVWWALGQLGVAFACFVAWRARRFGRPVEEPQPVELPGSLLVRARGELYRRGRSHGAVAARLQGEARRRVRDELGLPPDAPLPVARAASVLGAPPAEVERLLVAPPPASGRTSDLVAYAGDLDRLVAPLDPAHPPHGEPAGHAPPAPPGPAAADDHTRSTAAAGAPTHPGAPR